MSFSFSELDFLKPELGAEYTGSGTHFAVFSAHAEQMELCLFSPDGKKEVARLPLPKREGDIWSGYIAGVGRARSMPTARTVPTIRRTDIASIPTSCCSIPMPSRSLGI